MSLFFFRFGSCPFLLQGYDVYRHADGILPRLKPCHALQMHTLYNWSSRTILLQDSSPYTQVHTCAAPICAIIPWPTGGSDEENCDTPCHYFAGPLFDCQTLWAEYLLEQQKGSEGSLEQQKGSEGSLEQHTHTHTRKQTRRQCPK